MSGRYFYNNSLGLAHGVASQPDPPEYDFINDTDEEEDQEEEVEGDDD